MATYFGEILEVSSRAVDDEEIGHPSPYKLEFHAKVDPKDLKCEIGVFAFGKIAITFVHSYFCSTDIKELASAHVLLPFHDNMQYSGLNYSKKPKEVARVYVSQQNEKVLVCEVEDSLPEHLSLKLYENVIKFCTDNSEALVLTTSPSCMYCNVAEQVITEETFVRYLVSKNQANKNLNLGCPPLKGPNSITNFPAALLTNFEILMKSAVLYVCYFETLDSEFEVVDIFSNLLNLPVWEKFPRMPDAKERLLNAVKRNRKTNNNNLYI